MPGMAVTPNRLPEPTSDADRPENSWNVNHDGSPWNIDVNHVLHKALHSLQSEDIVSAARKVETLLKWDEIASGLPSGYKGSW